MKNLKFIGAACGLGARNRQTELAPQYFSHFCKQKECDLLTELTIIAAGDSLTKKALIPIPENNTSSQLKFDKERGTQCSNRYISNERRSQIDDGNWYKSANERELFGSFVMTTLLPFYKKLARSTGAAAKQAKIPIVLGGDHSIAIGTWSGIISATKSTGNFGLIWVDAHMDAHTFKTSPSKLLHGMPVAVLLGKGEEELTQLYSKKAKISPQHLCLIGIRSFEKAEERLLRKLGVRIYYMEEVRTRGFITIFKEALKIATSGTKAFGISIDVDAFDPEFAPGTGTPVPQGLSPLEVFRSIQGLARHEKLAGIEIAEYNPKLDIYDKTGNLVKKLLEEMTKKVEQPWY